MKKLWGDGNVLYADGGYTLVKIYQTMYLKPVHWIIHKWHLNKVDKKEILHPEYSRHTQSFVYLLNTYCIPEMLKIYWQTTLMRTLLAWNLCSRKSMTDNKRVNNKYLRCQDILPDSKCQKVKDWGVGIKRDKSWSCVYLSFLTPLMRIPCNFPGRLSSSCSQRELIL